MAIDLGALLVLIQPQNGYHDVVVEGLKAIKEITDVYDLSLSKYKILAVAADCKDHDHLMHDLGRINGIGSLKAVRLEQRLYAPPEDSGDGFEV